MNCKLLKNVQDRWNYLQILNFKNVRTYSSKANPVEDPPEIPVNPLKKYHPANNQKTNGDVYDIKPFKMMLQEGKNYHWCLCGHSRTQPLCDGTHNSIFLKLKHKPIKFTVTKTKEYWLCNCKQTKNRPFCDGTHAKGEWVIKRY